MYNWHPSKCIGCEKFGECRKPGGDCRKAIHGMPPPNWPNDFLVAVEIYGKTVGISQYDAGGFPTLEKLEFVLQSSDFHVDSRESFMNHLISIRHFDCKLRSEKRNG